MTYQEFVETITTLINERAVNGMHAEVHTSLKNNNISHVGITISEPEINISPTIYMEEFYQEFQQGLAILEILSLILEIYHEIRFDHSWKLDEVREFTSIQDQIVYKLIHKKENAPLLVDIPYIAYHDLAIVFYIMLDMNDSGSGTILITNTLLSAWAVTTEDLYRVAKQNTPLLLPPKFNTMHSVLCQMLGTDCVDGDFADNHMYILTNVLNQFGAAVILYPNVLEEIAMEINDDYYLLPSSIHELVILPRKYSPSTEDIDRMIVEINATQISPDEILSDHSYYYSRLHKSLFLTH